MCYLNPRVLVTVWTYYVVLVVNGQMLGCRFYLVGTAQEKVLKMVFFCFLKERPSRQEQLGKLGEGRLWELR